MNKTPTVSVVMPAYNVEKTIGRAIDSVIHQTYTNLELIIVNDGSTDATLDVIRGYEDSRIVVVSQPNGGLSCARNTGINRATGEYLTFIDSDDWYEESYLERMVSSFMSNHSQLIACGMIFHKSKGVVYSTVYDVCFDSLFDNKEFLSLLETGVMNSTCDKMYELHTIREYDLRFKTISIVEDLEFNLRYVELIRRACFIPYHLYHYDNTTSVLTKKVSSDMFDNYIHLHAWLFSRLSVTNFNLVSRFIFHQYYSFFIRYIALIINKQKELSEIREVFDFYLSNPLVNHSFEVYHSKVMGERFLKNILWHRCYRLLTISLFFIQKKEQLDSYLRVKKYKGMISHD